jgi:hypothetical protein
MSAKDDVARLHFVPWLRYGATSAISATDRLRGPLSANASLSPWIRIAGEEIAQSAHLRGPGHVTALGPSTIVRTEPVANASDFEPNYFPFVEVRPADLPWRYTPAAAGMNAQLRPWLVLVVARQQQGVTVGTEPGVSLPVLRIEAPATASRELPDLADAAAWAHVQSTSTPAQIASVLANDPDAATARLICPRRLQPSEAWHACLVPAFDVGVKAGLGESGSANTLARPAWDLSSAKLDQGALRLPVFYHWTFSTGPEGDFEALVRRLEPDQGKTLLGRAPLDVSDPGPPLPKPPAMRPSFQGDYVGGLKSPGVHRKSLPAELSAWLDTELSPLLERGAEPPEVAPTAPADYQPERDDPVVTPPLYASLQSECCEVREPQPGREWLRPLNIDPQLRAVAGLGAQCIRVNQEQLMASAWAQADAAREATRALNHAQCAIEVGRSIARRMAAWERGCLVQATKPLHPWIGASTSTTTLAQDIAASAVPHGLVSAPFTRVVRSQTSLGRTWTRYSPAPDQTRLTPVATNAFLDATSPHAARDLQGALDFAETKLPAGAWTNDPVLDSDATPSLTGIALDRPLSARHLERLGRFAMLTGPKGTMFDGTLATALQIRNEIRDSVKDVHPDGAGASQAAPTLDLSNAANTITAELDPRPHIQSGIVRRIPALGSQLDAEGLLPARLALAPVFEDALCWDLVEIDSRYLVAGVDELQNNRVTLLSVDDDFVAAFLAGANHEMSREFIWREFPCSPSATFFARFWDTGPDGADDIDAISNWTRPRLGANVQGVSASPLTVALIRGDVILRYPEVHVYLTRGIWSSGVVIPDPGQIKEAVLFGALDKRSIFCGFPVAIDRMRGDRSSDSQSERSAGWFVTIEEPSQKSRFGLDAAAADGSDLTSGAITWRDLSWGHLVPSGGKIEDLMQASARTPLPDRTSATLDSLTWGHNAAHMAAITWQRPFRLLVHADRLLPP